MDYTHKLFLTGRTSLYYIETETKWFSTWRFQIHFLEWKCMHFDKYFTDVYPKGPIQTVKIALTTKIL